MTENIENMCRTLGEMLPNEMNARHDAFILCSCSDDGEKTVLISYGTLENLATTFVVGLQRMVEQIPERMRSPLLNGIADTIRNL